MKFSSLQTTRLHLRWVFLTLLAAPCLFYTVFYLVGCKGGGGGTTPVFHDFDWSKNPNYCPKDGNILLGVPQSCCLGTNEIKTDDLNCNNSDFGSAAVLCAAEAFDYSFTESVRLMGETLLLVSPEAQSRFLIANVGAELNGIVPSGYTSGGAPTPNTLTPSGLSPPSELGTKSGSGSVAITSGANSPSVSGAGGGWADSIKNMLTGNKEAPKASNGGPIAHNNRPSLGQSNPGGSGGGSGISNVPLSQTQGSDSAVSHSQGMSYSQGVAGTAMNSGGGGTGHSTGVSSFRAGGGWGSGNQAPVAPGGSQQYGGTGEVQNPMTSEDPEDYFTRIDASDSLFKIINQRYRKTMILWTEDDITKMKGSGR